MLSTIFWNALQISVTVSAVGGVLLALRGLLKRRYPARTMCWVWFALALRLLVPMQLTLPKPALTITPPPVQTVVTAPPEVSMLTDDAAGETVAAQTTRVPTTHMSMLEVVMGIWLAGAGALLVWHMVAYAWFRRQIQRSSRPSSNEAILNVLSDTRRALGIRREIALRVTPFADCPMLVGALRPMLLLPTDTVDLHDAALIFRHELLHWKHGDLAVKMVLALAADVHWMNPCVRLLARAGAADLELACDSAVIHGMDFAQRKYYGQVILQAAGASCNARRRDALLSRFAGDKKGLKERMQNLFDGTVKKRGAALLLIVTLLLAVVGGSFSIRQDAAAADTSVTEQLTQLAQTWGAGVQARNAKPNYDMMTAKNAKAFYQQQQKRVTEVDPKGALTKAQREKALWNIGVSSPAVNGFAVAAVDPKKLQATLVYNWHATGAADTRTAERLTFVRENGKLKVAEYGNDSMPGKGALPSAVDSLGQFELLYANDLGLPDPSYLYGDNLEAVTSGYDAHDAAQCAQNQLHLVGGKVTAQSDYLAPKNGGGDVQGKVLTYTFADNSVVKLTMLNIYNQIYLPMDWTREDGSNSRTNMDLARQWAQGGQHKSAQYRYPIMQQELQEQFVRNQAGMNGDDTWYWKIVGSSPWIERWTVIPEQKEQAVRVVYASWDSTPHEYRGDETLQFGKDAKGRSIVTATTDTTRFGALVTDPDSVTQFTRLYDNALGLPDYTEERLAVLQEKGRLSTPEAAICELFFTPNDPWRVTAQTNGGLATADCVLPQGGTLRFTLENRGSEAKPLWYPTEWTIVK